MKYKIKKALWLLTLVLTLCSTSVLAGCETNKNLNDAPPEKVDEIRDRGTLLVEEKMMMSDGYLANGKTILCRAADKDRYQSLADIDKPEVRVMVNPGGLNEKFAYASFPHASIYVYPTNEDIPTLVAEGQGDVMITEITEAPYYVKNDSRLAAPLLGKPFTHGEIGILMRKGQDNLMQIVNTTLQRMKEDGTISSLKEKYGLEY